MITSVDAGHSPVCTTNNFNHHTNALWHWYRI